MKSQIHYKWTVCVRCMTYNQSAYITDAMNGFTMQQTNFPYVCTIVDDASTDGEPEVIRNYLEKHFDLEDKSTYRNEENDNYILTFARHKNNRNCHFAVFWLKYNHYKIPEHRRKRVQYISEWNENAKYLANCEGDDYWTAPQKLQMQVDYLETHPNIVLSCHRYSITDVLTGKTILAKNPYFDCKKNKDEFEFNLRYAFMGPWITKTLTIMMRSKFVNPENNKKFKYARDVHSIYFMLKNGNGVCHSLNAGVYRKNVSTSVFGNLDKTQKTCVGFNVYSEMANVTNDPIIRAKANINTIKYCTTLLKPCGGGYFYAIKVLFLIHRGINFIKRGFRRNVSPISS